MAARTHLRLRWCCDALRHAEAIALLMLAAEKTTAECWLHVFCHVQVLVSRLVYAACVNKMEHRGVSDTTNIICRRFFQAQNLA